MIVATGKARNRMRVPDAREETIRIELTVTLINFNLKMIEPSCQSRAMLKLMQLNYQSGKFIRRSAMKICVEIVKRKLQTFLWILFKYITDQM